jgi:hypothetical protein
MHTAIPDRGWLKRDPHADTAMILVRVPIGLVLMPRRFGTMSGRLVDCVVAGKFGLGAQFRWASAAPSTSLQCSDALWDVHPSATGKVLFKDGFKSCVNPHTERLGLTKF